jgi:TonB family protein
MSFLRSKAMRLLVFFMGGCAGPSPPPQPQAGTPTTFAAILQPGCLLPGAEALRRSSATEATLMLRIDEFGVVQSSSFESGTGNASLDAALQASAAKCKFAPAFRVELSPPRRVDVPYLYRLSAKWPASGAVVGLQRCLRPDYPHAARRAEESGRVTVLFRLNSTSGQVEVQLQPDSAPLRILRPLSVQAVGDCLAHKEVVAEVPKDKWFPVAFVWRLE